MRPPAEGGQRFDLVVVESPYRSLAETDTVWRFEMSRNRLYLQAAMRDCFDRGEFPYASHGLYTQPGVLNDSNKEERELGIVAGYAWGMHADKVAVYTDLGISEGMTKAIRLWLAAGKPIEYRTLEGWGE